MEPSPKNSNGDPTVSSWNILALKGQHDMFVEEAFAYLLDHFEIRSKHGYAFRIFTEEMGRALVTIGYIFRRRLRTFFRTSQMNFRDTSEFEKFAEYFEAVKTQSYFFRFLRRVSHIFELTMYCLKEGYDYTETAQKIAADHEYIIFFETNGGWSRLNETASFLAEVGEMLYPVIRTENPQDVHLKPFVSTVQYLEFSHSNSVTPIQKKIMKLLKNYAMDKLNDIHTVDPRIKKVFYNTICQHSSCVFVMNSKLVCKPWNWNRELKLDIQSEKEEIINSFRSQLKFVMGEREDLYIFTSATIKLAGYFANFRHLSDLISVELEMSHANLENGTQSKLSLSEKSCQSLNEYFIVGYEYIERRKRLAMESSEERRVPSNIRNILDENIDQNNFFMLNDGRYVVYRPQCKFDCNTTTIFAIPD